MKTIPVSLVLLAGVFTAGAEPSQDEKTPQPQRPRAEEGGRQRPDFDAMWKRADADANGSVSKDEFFALERIAKLPEEKRAKIFERLDKNHDGTLTREELEQIGKGHRPMPRLEELDKDKSGGVSFEEFSAAEFVQKLPEERRKEMFQRMDRDGDGQLTPKDRPKQDDREGREGGPPRIKELVDKLDVDHNGSVSFEEFKKAPFAADWSEDKQEERFQKLDRNKDHKLDEADAPPPGEAAPRRDGPPSSDPSRKGE